jgi:hypothetical protein
VLGAHVGNARLSVIVGLLDTGNLLCGKSFSKRKWRLLTTFARLGDDILRVPLCFQELGDSRLSHLLWKKK